MIMLMGITLPAVKQVMRDSGVREASRQLNAYSPWPRPAPCSPAAPAAS
jgi:hypothetical protein